MENSSNILIQLGGIAYDATQLKEKLNALIETPKNRQQVLDGGHKDDYKKWYNTASNDMQNKTNEQFLLAKKDFIANIKEILLILE